MYICLYVENLNKFFQQKFHQKIRRKMYDAFFNAIIYQYTKSLMENDTKL